MRWGLFVSAQHPAELEPEGGFEEHLEQVRLAVGITHFVFRVQWPGLPHADAKRTLKLLAT